MNNIIIVRAFDADYNDNKSVNALISFKPETLK
jgi:hypothetical protein